MHELLMILRVPTTKYELMKVSGKSERAVASTLRVLKQHKWLQEAGLNGKSIQWTLSELGKQELLKLFADLPMEEEIVSTWPHFDFDGDKSNLKLYKLTDLTYTKEEALKYASENMESYYRYVIALSYMGDNLTYLNSLK